MPIRRRKLLRFSPLYRRVRIDTIQRDKRKDPALFLKRVERLIRTSAWGKMFGEWNDGGRLLNLPDNE